MPCSLFLLLSSCHASLNKLNRATQTLTRDLGREPTSKELAERADLPIAVVRKARREKSAARRARKG